MKLKVHCGLHCGVRQKQATCEKNMVAGCDHFAFSRFQIFLFPLSKREIEKSGKQKRQMK